MQAYEKYLEEDFIIWNSQFGVRDFVNIGEIDTDNKTAWLDEPYEMVGPFCLDELCKDGLISFAACMVMSKERWSEDQKELYEESLIRQEKLQEELYRNIHQNNNRKRNQRANTQKGYRKLLDLPLEGSLEISQIKTAYRKIVKKEHPDVGGSHEKFIEVTEARDILLEALA